MLIFLNLPPTPCLFMCVSTHSLACTFRAHCVQRQFSDSSQWSQWHIQYTQCAQTVQCIHISDTQEYRQNSQAPTKSCLVRVFIVKCKPNRSDLNQWNVQDYTSRSDYLFVDFLIAEIPHLPPRFVLWRSFNKTDNREGKKAATYSYTKIIGLDRCQW
jgi:hypothetical protein